MIGLWTNEKDIMKDFYYNLFNAKLDLFNLIRLSLQKGDYVKN